MHKRSFHDRMSVTTPPFQVANHKTATSMGTAPVMLSGSDLTLLRQYIRTCRRRIAPTAEEVFSTSSGCLAPPQVVYHLLRGCLNAQPFKQNCDQGPGWIGEPHPKVVGGSGEQTYSCSYFSGFLFIHFHFKVH